MYIIRHIRAQLFHKWYMMLICLIFKNEIITDNFVQLYREKLVWVADELDSADWQCSIMHTCHKMYRQSYLPVFWLNYSLGSYSPCRFCSHSHSSLNTLCTQRPKNWKNWVKINSNTSGCWLSKTHYFLREDLPYQAHTLQINTDKPMTIGFYKYEKQ